MHKSKATKIVGGVRNQVVEWHPDACQHCGVYAEPAESTCRMCGIRVHSRCVTFWGGQCDICRHNVDNETRCALCEQEDDDECWKDATDRLVKVGIGWGRTWRDESGKIRRRVHDIRCLSSRGSTPMTDGKLTADPLVVHTWCGMCLFQVSPLCPEEWRETILEAIVMPKCIEVGQPNNSMDYCATFETHRCIFCHKKVGWATFCCYHLSHAQGCDLCRDGHVGTTRTISSNAFHPSCAVRFGMQRFSRKGFFGMLCARHKHHRAAGMLHLRPWLGYPSGINKEVVVTASQLTPPSGIQLKGQRYQEQSSLWQPEVSIPHTVEDPIASAMGDTVFDRNQTAFFLAMR